MKNINLHIYINENTFKLQIIRNVRKYKIVTYEKTKRMLKHKKIINFQREQR